MQLKCILYVFLYLLRICFLILVKYKLDYL